MKDLKIRTKTQKIKRVQLRQRNSYRSSKTFFRKLEKRAQKKCKTLASNGTGTQRNGKHTLTWDNMDKRRPAKNPKTLEKRICLARKPKQLWTDYELCKRKNSELYHQIHYKN